MQARGQGWRGATLCLPLCFLFAPLAAGCGSAHYPWHCQGACGLSRVSPGPRPWSSCGSSPPQSPLWLVPRLPLGHFCPEEVALSILVTGRCDARKAPSQPASTSLRRASVPLHPLCHPRASRCTVLQTSCCPWWEPLECGVKPC